jgi:hypothetical protein
VGPSGVGALWETIIPPAERAAAIFRLDRPGAECAASIMQRSFRRQRSRASGVHRGSSALPSRGSLLPAARSGFGVPRRLLPDRHAARIATAHKSENQPDANRPHFGFHDHERVFPASSNVPKGGPDLKTRSIGLKGGLGRLRFSMANCWRRARTSSAVSGCSGRRRVRRQALRQAATGTRPRFNRCNMA